MAKVKMKESLPLEVGMNDYHNEERTALRRQFLSDHGLASIDLETLPFDCSFRRYFRLPHAILMDAPPTHEDAFQFHFISDILREAGLSVPQVYAADHENGFLLIEDFGDIPYRKAIQQGTSEKLLYGETVKALVHLHSHFSPSRGLETLSEYHEELEVLNTRDPSFVNSSWVPDTNVFYDFPSLTQKNLSSGMTSMVKFGMTMRDLPTYSLDLFLDRASLFLEWHETDFPESTKQEFRNLWTEAYLNQPVLPTTLAMRDVMIDNLHWLPEREGFKRCGFIDFQDASLAPVSYDLVSLLEDARWDIQPNFAKEMLEIYFASFPDINPDKFYASYCLWGAQRTVRIMGVFFRKAKRDGMPKYLNYLPHLWKTLERDLSYPSLAGLRKWFKAYGGMK